MSGAKVPKVPKVKPPRLITWLVQFFDNKAVVATRSYADRDAAYQAAEDWRTADGRWSEITCVDQERQLR